MEIRRYTFKLYPTAAQVARFERNLDLHRTLYNAALEERIDAYRKAGKTITRFDQSKSVPEIRKVYPEIGELQANSIIETLVRLDNAYQAFFRRAKAGAGSASGFPRFKGKHFFDSWTYPADYAFGFEQTGPSRFRIRGGGPKKDDTCGWVKAKGRMPVDEWEPRTATIMRREGVWWLSLVVRIAARRTGGTADTTVHLDMIDQFAEVNGIAPPDLAPAMLAERRLDEAKSERDRKYKRGSVRWRRLRLRIAGRSAVAARIRKDILHNWTTRVVAASASVTAIAPPIKETTATARGNEKFHGAAVRTVAELNRTVLSQAPAAALQMLAYKAAEAGVEFREVADNAPAAAIGRDISEAKKTERKARRQLKRLAS